MFRASYRFCRTWNCRFSSRFTLRCSRRSPIAAVFYGMSIGLVQDSLSHQPIGMFGIVKTLVGYFAASVSMRFDVENPVVTFILSFFFYFFHQFFYWVLTRALLGEVGRLRCAADAGVWLTERGCSSAAVSDFG